MSFCTCGLRAILCEGLLVRGGPNRQFAATQHHACYGRRSGLSSDAAGRRTLARRLVPTTTSRRSMDSSSLWCCKSIPAAQRDQFARPSRSSGFAFSAPHPPLSILRQPSVYRTEADPQGPCDHIGPFASLNATPCANAHRCQRRMIQLASIVFSHATLESNTRLAESQQKYETTYGRLNTS